VLGVKTFKTITSIVEAAGDGTAAAYSYGVGGKMGLGHLVKLRCGIPAIIAEISGGAVIAAPTGTMVVPATSGPNGSYAPALAPDGTRDYCLYYEYDASLNR
jgi:hypothetical protein